MTYPDNFAYVALADDGAVEDAEREDIERWEQEHFIPTHCQGPDMIWYLAKTYRCSESRCKDMARWAWDDKSSPRSFACPTCDAPKYEPCRVLTGKRKGLASSEEHAARFALSWDAQPNLLRR